MEAGPSNALTQALSARRHRRLGILDRVGPLDVYRDPDRMLTTARGFNRLTPEAPASEIRCRAWSILGAPTPNPEGS